MRSAAYCLPILLGWPALACAGSVPTSANGSWVTFADVNSPVKHCAVEARTRHGAVLVFGGSDEPGALRLNFDKPGWALNGSHVPVQVVFSGGAAFNLDGVGAQTKIRTSLVAPEATSFLHYFSTNQSATVAFPFDFSPPWKLDLRGTRRALAAMMQCVLAAGLNLPPPLHAASFASTPSGPDAAAAPVASENLTSPTGAAVATPQPAAQAAPDAPAAAKNPAPAAAPTPAADAAVAPAADAAVATVTPEQIAALQKQSEAAAQQREAENAIASAQGARLGAVLSTDMYQAYQDMKAAQVQFDDATAVYATLKAAAADNQSLSTPQTTHTPEFVGAFTEVSANDETAYYGGFSPHGSASLVAISGRVVPDKTPCHYDVSLTVLARSQPGGQLAGTPATETYACDDVLGHKVDHVIDTRILQAVAGALRTR
jgi:hypothetical protein